MYIQGEDSSKDGIIMLLYVFKMKCDGKWKEKVCDKMPHT
jgi:hypothetical protein